jgi:hypothetical protein
MDTEILNHPSGAEQTSKMIRSLHFTSYEWQIFWQLLVVGSSMTQILESLESGMIVKENKVHSSRYLIEKWNRISDELVAVWKSESCDQIE